MKLQKLTSLDINIMAFELDRLLTGNVIRNIVSKTNDIYFSFSGFILRYFVLDSTPYFLKAKYVPEGGRWLSNIINGKIKKITQKDKDRLILFEIIVFDRLGKRKDFNLYFEFFKNGNVTLTDKDDTIIHTLRPSKEKSTKYKIVQPKGFNVLACDENYIPNPQEVNKIKTLKLLQYALIDDYSSDNLLKFIFNVKNDPSPHLLKDIDNKICGYSIYGPPFTSNISGQKTDSLIKAITLYVESKSAEKSIKPPDFKKLLKKAETKFKTLQASLDQTENFQKYRLYGELLLANKHSIKKGKKLVILPNPYSEHNELVEIPLNPAIAPEKNAEDYFKNAGKLEASIPILKERIEKQKKEIEKIKKMADSFIPTDIVEQTKPEAKVTKEMKLPFRQYKLDGGWRVYIGKSALSNDELTFSFARKNDIWFHAWQASGSHVVLRRPEKGAIPDKKILFKTASLAAYFSKAKTSGKVPVIYTEVRYVRKIKKYPGKVTVTNEKQLIVEPAARP